MGLRTVAADAIMQSGNCGLQPSGSSMHWAQCQCRVGKHEAEWHGEGVGPLLKPGLAFPLLTAVANSQDNIPSNGSVLGSRGTGSQTGTRAPSFTSAQMSPVAWRVLSVIMCTLTFPLLLQFFSRLL